MSPVDHPMLAVFLQLPSWQLLHPPRCQHLGVECRVVLVLHGPMPITHQMPKISRIALQTAKLLIVLFGKSVPCHLCKKSD